MIPISTISILFSAQNRKVFLQRGRTGKRSAPFAGQTRCLRYPPCTDAAISAASIISQIFGGSHDTTLKVFDAAGHEIAALVDGELAAGGHALVFDATDLPSGIYLYRLATPAFLQTRKAVLLR